MKELPRNSNKIDLEICSKMTGMNTEDTEKALKSYMPDDLVNKLKIFLYSHQANQSDADKIISDIYILISNIYKLYNKFIDDDVLPKSENFETVLTDEKNHKVYAEFFKDKISKFAEKKAQFKIECRTDNYALSLKTIWPFCSELWSFPRIYIEIEYNGKKLGISKTMNCMNYDKGYDICLFNDLK